MIDCGSSTHAHVSSTRTLSQYADAISCCAPFTLRMSAFRSCDGHRRMKIMHTSYINHTLHARTLADPALAKQLPQHTFTSITPSNTNRRQLNAEQSRFSNRLFVQKIWSDGRSGVTRTKVRLKILPIMQTFALKPKAKQSRMDFACKSVY